MRTLIPTLLALLVGCSSNAEPESITLATTTSFRDSGLLDELRTAFEAESGIEVKVIAVGSGQALELGRRGDVDVLVTHAPEAEAQFMADGFGSERRPLMHNDFVLVGPPDDPAGIKGEQDVATAFRTIAEKRATFVSRGDESGTHMKERAVWAAADIEPRGAWYVESGVGMAAALRMAFEKRAHTLADRPTFLANRDGLDLVILSEGDPRLANRYAVITIDPERHPHVNATGGERFAKFLLSRVTQRRIAEFGVDRYGEPLFFVEESP